MKTEDKHMTRREYLTALNQYLVTMSESEKTAILKEYDDHYRRGFEAGKTEAQVSASLGSPYDVANELLAGRRPNVPTYPPKPRPQATQSSQNSVQRTGAYQPRTQTSTSYQQRTETQTNTQPHSAPSYPPQQQIFSEPAYPTQQSGYSAPSYPSQQQSYSEPAYTERPVYPASAYPAHQPGYPASAYPEQPSYPAPAYPSQPQSRPASAYAAHPETQHTARPQSHQAYVDYDREAEEDPLPEKKKRESKYSTSGIIVVAVLGVFLVPTLGFAVYYLVRGLYELIRAFPGTGIALIAAGGSLNADSLWICLGLIFIGISFLALTGLLVMAIIEIAKLAVKLFRYAYKECKKMIKEGSF